MLGYVMVGTNNLKKAIIFYDEVLKVLNLERNYTDEVCAGYAQKNGDGTVEFYVTEPVNKEKATFGNGTQVSFVASTREIVDKFHEVGLKAGGKAKVAEEKGQKVLVFIILIFVIWIIIKFVLSQIINVLFIYKTKT